MKSLLSYLFLWIGFISETVPQKTVGTIAYEPDLMALGLMLIYPQSQPNAMRLNFCSEMDWHMDSTVGDTGSREATTKTSWSKTKVNCSTLTSGLYILQAKIIQRPILIQRH